MNNLYQEILKFTEHSICDNESTYRIFLERLKGGNLTRDENSESHFCVYFLPYNWQQGENENLFSFSPNEPISSFAYNLQNKKVFIVEHKKSGLWLSPGGHIDKGENLLGALNREIEEELGIKNHFKEAPSPFLLTITPINNPVQPCKTHYDIWYLLMTDGNNFNINPQEFHDTKWLAIEEARRVMTDPANIKALEVVENIVL